MHRHRADLSVGLHVVLYLNLILTQKTKAAVETKNRDKVCPPTSSAQTLLANPLPPLSPSVLCWTLPSGILCVAPPLCVSSC